MILAVHDARDKEADEPHKQLRPAPIEETGQHSQTTGCGPIGKHGQRHADKDITSVNSINSRRESKS